MIQVEKVTDDLLREIKELNKDFYGNAVLEWYINPNILNAVCVCYRDTNGILRGYIFVTCISELYYKALIKGDYIEELEDKYILYVKQSPYWYISSVVVDREYQRKGIATQLLNTLMQHPFEHLCAVTVSKEGKALLSKCLDVKEQISENCFILEKEL